MPDHGPVPFREASHQQDLLRYSIFYLLLVCQSKYKLTFKDHQAIKQCLQLETQKPKKKKQKIRTPEEKKTIEGGGFLKINKLQRLWGHKRRCTSIQSRIFF